MLEPGGYATKPNSREKEKCRDNAFPLRKLKNSGKTLARSSFVFEEFCAHRGFKRKRLKEL